MTHEELIAKAIEHANDCGVPTEQLHNPKVREAVVVTFTSKESSGKAEFYMDTKGNIISGMFSPEFTPKPKRKGKQFSKRAQKVLALASEESRRLGCDHVGSEHLLLGLLVYGEGAGSAALLESGLTPGALRSYLTATGSPPEEAPNGYGSSMRSVLRATTTHADGLGHKQIEPEHFVLALLDETDGGAIKALRYFRIDIAEVRKELGKTISGVESTS